MSGPTGNGLSTRDALNVLVREAKKTLEEYTSSYSPRSTPQQGGYWNGSHKFLHFYKDVHLVYIAGLSMLLLIGSVDLDNEISYILVGYSIFLALYTLLLYALQQLEMKKDKNFMKRRIENLTSYLSRSCDNLRYSIAIEPILDDMSGQQCFRDGIIVNVPKMLLVEGDLLLLRPGQTAPGKCRLPDGSYLDGGKKYDPVVVLDESTGAAIPLKSIRAMLCETIINDHLETCLSISSQPSILERQISSVINVVEKVGIFFTIIVIIVVIIRYLYGNSQSFFGSRFIFSIPSLILLPYTCPILPIVLICVRRWNNVIVSEGLGEKTYVYHSKDCLVALGNLTGASVVDKKGILSPVNPSLDKVVVFREAENSIIVPDVLDMSSELVNGKWRLYFDSQAWQDKLAQLHPIALNLQLNSCRHNVEYHAFLDHLSCVVKEVPRTIVTTSKRCMCQFPKLLGFSDNAIRQFYDTQPQSIAVYKRQPGDEPLPGLLKHRTPLEMAFCTLHSDIRSIHSHLLCQGTADVILDACSHVWDGQNLVPISDRLSRTVRDMYQRNSMTGYCLVLSYRPTTNLPDNRMKGKYIEAPVHEPHYVESLCTVPRSHSFDELLCDDIFSVERLKTGREVVEHLFTGQTLNGMVFMQYEALPVVVPLVESLENNCVRFIYFSKENELRSRIFAEKMGLEAGWNCHISLADDEEEDDRTNKDLYLASLGGAREKWDKAVFRKERLRKSYLSKSEIAFEMTDVDLRVSPSRQRSHTTPDKVGAMPNKAQLPMGLAAVRPHLEEVDNVPLLVGLFTDCSPIVNSEMINIMQDYGEVVLVIGSALNTANIDVFGQSDVSICVTPLTEFNCHHSSSNYHMNSSYQAATDVAASIMALSSDFHLNHTQILNLSDVIIGCRHRLESIRASLLFLFYCSLQLSMLIFVSTICFLPLMFTTQQVFLTVFVQFPLMVVGTIWTPFHPEKTVIKIACKSSLNVGHQQVSSAMLTFCIQFLPTTLFLIALFFFALVRNSTMLCSFSDAVCSFGEDAVFHLSTHEIRHLLGFYMILFTCITSASWVYPMSSLWYQVPFKSLPWIFSTLGSLITQLIFSYLSGVYFHRILSVYTLAVILLWSPVILTLNELYKLRHIRDFHRIQRRTKLAFDTKLGMNSPY